MKLSFYTLLLFISFAVNGYAQSIARVENIKIKSEELGQERELLIYTPVEYDNRTLEFYNVLYVFDSQNRKFFDFTSAISSFLSSGDYSKDVIVVGITSPYIEEHDYYRNNDMLPVLKTEASKNRFGNNSGNIENFLKYVTQEVVPYVDSNYRTNGESTAIGHSLSASFILHSMVRVPNLFSNYIAISPNLAYEDDKIANELIAFDYSKLKNYTYLFLSHANEGIDYWPEWAPAREKVYDFFNTQLKDDKIDIRLAEYPTKNHENTYPPSVENALSYYFENVISKQENKLSDTEYEVLIKVKVPNKDDEIFITGNQPNLGNWEPAKIKLERVSDFERQIRLSLKSIAQFKFTRGSWETEAELLNAYGAIMIKPESKKVFEFEIDTYFDRY